MSQQKETFCLEKTWETASRHINIFTASSDSQYFQADTYSGKNNNLQSIALLIRFHYCLYCSLSTTTYKHEVQIFWLQTTNRLMTTLSETSGFLCPLDVYLPIFRHLLLNSNKKELKYVQDCHSSLKWTSTFDEEFSPKSPQKQNAQLTKTRDWLFVTPKRLNYKLPQTFSRLFSFTKNNVNEKLPHILPKKQGTFAKFGMRTRVWKSSRLSAQCFIINAN